MSTTKAKRARIRAALHEQQRQSASQAVRLHAALANRVGINITDVNVLALLDKTGPLTPGEIAKHAGLSRGGAITAVVDRLEKGGFLRRHRDLEDRRRVLVELIPDGPYEALTTMLAGLNDRYAALINQYTDEQLELLLTFAHQAAEIVDHCIADLQPAD